MFLEDDWLKICINQIILIMEEQTHITSKDQRQNKNDDLVLQLFKGAGESSMCFKVSKKERDNFKLSKKERPLKYVRHTDAIFKVTLTDQITQQDLIKKINSQRKKKEQNNPDVRTNGQISQSTKQDSQKKVRKNYMKKMKDVTEKEMMFLSQIKNTGITCIPTILEENLRSFSYSQYYTTFQDFVVKPKQPKWAEDTKDFALGLVLKYYPNGNLKDYQMLRKRKGNPLSPTEIKFILQKGLEFIKKFNDVGKMHRNIKLQNMLLDENFNVGFCDFKALFEDQNRREVLQSNEYVGCKLNRAPEIEDFNPEPDEEKRNKKQEKQEQVPAYNKSIDVYSLGKAIHYLLYDHFDHDRQNKTAVFLESGKESSSVHKGQNYKRQEKIVKQLEILLKYMLVKEKIQKKRFYSVGQQKERPTVKQSQQRPFAGDLIDFTQEKLNKKLYEQLKELKFRWLSQEQQKQARQQLLQKKNSVKVTLKKVFYLKEVGYCFILTNQKTFLALLPDFYGKSAPHVHVELDEQLWSKLRLGERCLAFNSLPNQKKQNIKTIFLNYEQLNEEELREFLNRYPGSKIEAYDKILNPQWFDFMQQWRSEVDIDDYAGDETRIVEMEFIRERVVRVTLSNGVHEFIFSEEHLKPQEGSSILLVFNKFLSLNYDKMNDKKVRFRIDGSQILNIDEYQFEDVRKAKSSQVAGEYIMYVKEYAEIKYSQRELDPFRS